MRKIYLYGNLGEKYGTEHTFDVSSIGEALRALECAYTGFRIDIAKNDHYEVFQGKDIATGVCIEESDLAMISSNGDYHIVPIVEGAKSMSQRGAVFAVVGIALAATGWGIGAAGILETGLVTNTAISVGVGIAISGVAMFLSPVIDQKENDVEDVKSYTFSGIQNITKQGGVVPVVYGKFEVGSTVISTSLEAISV